ncbi:MAG: WD40-like repeat-like protein [Pedosphaera sp.]|nr:WD40-like repeat-like protein [Pedosphaera sp.]
MSLESRALSLRIWALLLPPVGLSLLWKGPRTLAQKLLGTLGILLYCLPYSALVIWLLVQFTGLQVEWRGGFPPVLTYSKTTPNYDAVEKNRTQQAKRGGQVLEHHSSSLVGAYWTDFRGPNRDGRYEQTSILTKWPAEGLRELWRQPIGGGYGSFVVAEGLAFTIEQRREFETVAAYDFATGRELWTNSWPALFQESMGGDGPRATPTYHAGRIFAQGAEGELRCLEAATGRLIWSKNILSDNGVGNVSYGMAASPLIVDGKVIVQPGGPNGKSVVAYDEATGATVWKSLSDPAAYSSPMIVNLAGQRQLLIVTATRAVGLAVDSGKLLWEHPWVVKLDNRNIVQPVILGTNRFFLSAGYGTGCEAVEITQSKTGLSAQTIWKNTLLKNKFASSVFWQGCLYGLDEDILTCLDAATGERKWKDGRYDYGQLLLADGHLVILGGNGTLALVRAIPDRYEELAQFPAIHGKTWNNPAIAQGKLLVRNAVEMACFDISGR